MFRLDLCILILSIFLLDPNRIRAQQLSDVQERFLSMNSSMSFGKHLHALSSEPHIAGSASNESVRDYISSVMRNAGLKVEITPYDVYIPEMPGTATLEILHPTYMTLPLKEKMIPEDPYSVNQNLTQGFNAYSGSGVVEGELVYANYGTKEDFERLKKMGIDIKDKIVIARYGRNFRGYKAKYAEEGNAKGLIIYTDPMDSGYMKGLSYPEGKYYDESAIQRGSLLVLPWVGDPLTPEEAALPIKVKTKSKRKQPSEVNELLNIPVIPIGYGAAKEIFSRMNGSVVPNGWQGGLPYTYRLTGGSDLIVRMNVDQKRSIQTIYNIVGTLEGDKFPNEWIILGCHYDAWTYGAIDPNSGTAMLLTLAEDLGKLLKEGFKTKRSIKIVHWDAEELGLIGSTEWVEHHVQELKKKAIAYLNADAAVGGFNVGFGASPVLKDILINATKNLTFIDSSKSIYEVWKGKANEPRIGDLGGGSDYLPFVAFAGVPSISGGTGGTSVYHSSYDNLHFYKKFVDSTYQLGNMVKQIFGTIALNLSEENVIPYKPSQYAIDLTHKFNQFLPKIVALGIDSLELLTLQSLSKILYQQTQELESKLLNTSNSQYTFVNSKLIDLEKRWLVDHGMPFGSWYKSSYASSDPFSGYDSWILPLLEYGIATKNTDQVREGITIYQNIISNIIEDINQLIVYLE